MRASCAHRARRFADVSALWWPVCTVDRHLLRSQAWCPQWPSSFMFPSPPAPPPHRGPESGREEEEGILV